MAEKKHIVTGRLFLGQRGPLIPRRVQGMLQKYAYQAKVKVSPHILRYTCATELLRKGVDLVAVATILGHKNINTTTIYTRPRFEDLMVAIEKENLRTGNLAGHRDTPFSLQQANRNAGIPHRTGTHCSNHYFPQGRRGQGRLP